MDHTHHTHTTSPAVWYARIFGVAFLLAGIAGFVVNSEQNVAQPLLGLDVNLTHNIVHLLTGVAGLAAGFAALRYARTFAIALGVVYTLLGVVGFVVGDGNGWDIAGLFANINMADNVFHFVVGVLGIVAWAASRERTHDTI